MKLANWFAVAGCVGFGAVIALAAPGCTATVGGGNADLDGGFFGSDANGQPDTGANDTCLLCLQPYCSGNYFACTSDTACNTILECAKKCTTSDCSYACFQATPSGQARYSAFADCDTAAECGPCATQCPTQRAQQVAAGRCTTAPADAGTDDAGNPIDAGPAADAGIDLNACNACEQASCSTYAECQQTTSDCYKYNQCVLACTDANSCAACSTTYAAGAQAANQLGTCAATTCGAQCGISGQ